MDCQHTRNLLVAFQDAELADDDRRLVEEHLRGCFVCTAELAEFDKLREVVRSWPEPQPPAELWERIESAIEPSSTSTGQPRAAPIRSGIRARLTIVAALALVALGTGLWAWRLHRQPGQIAVNDMRPRLAVDLDRFLDDFQQDPQAASNRFLANYKHETIAPDRLREAAKEVRYETIAPNRLPKDFSVDAVYLLKMECCTGVQCVLKRKGSQVLAILQHTIDQPVWYGGRDVQIAEVHGKPTRIVRVNGRLAATWQKDGTYVSLVGANDMTELIELIASLEGGRKEK